MPENFINKRAKKNGIKSTKLILLYIQKIINTIKEIKVCIIAINIKFRYLFNPYLE